MHFWCKCGNRISDTTDFLSYKAHLLADQDDIDYTDGIERAVKNERLSREECTDEIILNLQFHYLQRKMYQCSQCGRIFIEDVSGKVFHVFAPEGTENKRLLTSVEAEAWRGLLHGEWYSDIPEWMERQGYVDAYTNDDSFTHYQEYDSWEELEKGYYALFEKLREAGKIRSALLRNDKEIVHRWSDQSQ